MRQYQMGKHSQNQGDRTTAPWPIRTTAPNIYGGVQVIFFFYLLVNNET